MVSENNIFQREFYMSNIYYEFLKFMWHDSCLISDGRLHIKNNKEIVLTIIFKVLSIKLRIHSSFPLTGGSDF